MAFVVKSTLGKGSYGTVFRTIDNFAFKRVHETSFDFPLIQELEVFSRIKHPCLIDGQIYLPNKSSQRSTQRINGKMLIHLSYRDYGIKMPLAYGNVDDKKINNRLKCFIDTVHAVAALHHAGFLHLDIKPKNVLIFDGDRYKLCDFGLSIHELEHYPDSSVITIDHRPLENLKSSETCYRKSSDIWSLGVFGINILTDNNFYEHNFSNEKMYLPELMKMNVKETVIDRFKDSEYQNLIPLFLRIMNRDEPHLRPSAREILSELGERFIEPFYITPEIPSLLAYSPFVKDALKYIDKMKFPEKCRFEIERRVKYISYAIGNDFLSDSTPEAIALVASFAIGIDQNVPKKLIPLMWEIVQSCNCIFDCN